MKTKISITRRNKNIGFGWTTITHQTPVGLDIDEVNAPDYTGTVKTVLAQIKMDRNYQSLGGTYHRDQWFVKVESRWQKIVFLDNPNDLYAIGWTDDRKYFLSSVDAEIIV